MPWLTLLQALQHQLESFQALRIQTLQNVSMVRVISSTRRNIESGPKVVYSRISDIHHNVLYGCTHTLTHKINLYYTATFGAPCINLKHRPTFVS